MKRTTTLLSVWLLGTFVAVALATFAVNQAGTRVVAQSAAPISRERLADEAARLPVTTAVTDAHDARESADNDDHGTSTIDPAGRGGPGPGGEATGDDRSSPDGPPSPASGAGNGAGSAGGPSGGNSASGSGSGGGSGSGSGSNGSPGGAPTTVAGSNGGSGNDSGGDGSAGGSGGGRGPSNPTPTTVAPAPVTRTYTIPGGSGTLTCTGASIQATAVPANGWQPDGGTLGPGTNVDIRFRRDDPRAESELRADCAGGVPHITEQS